MGPGGRGPFCLVALTVTGEGLVPDCRGCYENFGLYGGEYYYRRCDGEFFIWNDEWYWYLGPTLGDWGVNHWQGVQFAPVTGDYQPQTGAEGIATVSSS